MAQEMNQVARVWMIDDKWTLAEAKEISPPGVQIEVRGIRDEDQPPAYHEYHLILLDQDLGEEPSLSRIFDGSGVAGQLRGLARKQKVTLPPLVILTSEPGLFEFEIPAVGPERPFGSSFVGREAQLAPTLDVEWLLLKPDFGDDEALAKIRLRIGDLVNSYGEAARLAGDNGVSLEESSEYLKVDLDQPWASAAINAIEAALPPISQDPEKLDAPPRAPTSLLRWLLHRVLPYPGLFLSDFQLAARLGVRVDALDVAIESKKPWSRALAAGLYRGPGASLFERRWWTPAVDYAALQLFEESERFGDDAAALKALTGESVELLGVSAPVVVCDEHFVETAIAPLEEAVQVKPPGWPIEAMLPWLRIDTAALHPWLRHLVDPADAAEAGLQ